MSNRKGRPAIRDEAALRRIAEHLVAQEELGKHCSARAAILRTSDDHVTGNSRDADVWRLQRKWSKHGNELLAEARERRARARRRAISGVGFGPAMVSFTDLARAFSAHDEMMRASRRIQDEFRRNQDESRRIQDEFRRPFIVQDEIRRLTGAW